MKLTRLTHDHSIRQFPGVNNKRMKMSNDNDNFGKDVFMFQARVIESVSNWANDKAKENPGCVERFVCETYRTGETLSGVPYLLMSLTK